MRTHAHCLSVVALLASAASAWCNDTPARQPAYDLGEAEMQRFLHKPREIPAADPQVVRFWTQAWASSETKANSLRRPRPAAIKCRAPTGQCAAYDADGGFLYAVERRLPPSDARSCAAWNALLTADELERRCTGGGLQPAWAKEHPAGAPPRRAPKN